MTDGTNTDPLFIIGYKRSGTTMFRLILNSHPGLAIPPESEYFQKIPPKLGIKTHKENELNKIVHDLSGMKRCDFQLKLTNDQIREIIEPILPATTQEIIGTLYKYWGVRQGKPTARWGDKKPQNWKHVYRLKRWYPESQFLHIIRDPRDVYASIEEHFPEQIIGRNLIPPHIITAWQWRMANLEMIRQGKSLGPERYWSVKYEVLVNNPEECCRKCCEFLGIEYRKEMLDFQKSAKNPEVQGAKIDSGAHKHTTRRVHSGQIGRFRNSSLSEKVISDIEFICEDMFRMHEWRQRNGIGMKLARAIYLRSVCLLFDLVWKCQRVIKRSRGSL